MSAISLPYFSYPKTKETEANFRDWHCPICIQGDPEAFGGTVAHGAYDSNNVHIDGRKHPVHRYCLLSFLKWSTSCSECRVETNAAQVMPFWMKCRNAALRVYHSLPALGERSKNWVLNPANQVYVGFACMILGLARRKHSLTSMGLGLQAKGIHDAIQYGGQHIRIVRQIEHLANDLIQDMRKHYVIQVKLERLKMEASAHPASYTQIAPWIDSPDREKVLEGLQEISKAAKAAIFSDQIIHFWRTAAAVGAVYYSLKGSASSPVVRL